MVSVWVAGDHHIDPTNALRLEIGQRPTASVAAIDQHGRALWRLNQDAVALTYVDDVDPYMALYDGGGRLGLFGRAWR
jgi:hypothetical protein